MRRLLRVFVALALLAPLVVLVGESPAYAAIVPPGQPPSGPGGSDYCFPSVTETPVGTPLSTVAGQTYDDYWLYRPSGTWACGGTAPTVVPLVVMLHGYSPVGDPTPYLRFMRHLVKKRGAIVVFPRYGSVADGGFSPPGHYPYGTLDWTNSALGAVNAAITLVDGGTGIKTDHNDGIQIVGNSAGGIVGFNFAARALDGSQTDLPSWATPKSLFAVQPGTDSNLPETPPGGDPTVQDNLWDTLTSLPTALRLACMTSEHDTPSEWAGEIGCDRIWRKAVARGVTNKEIIHVRSDSYGWASGNILYSDHGMMPEGATDNTLDYFGIWKIAEALKECTTESLNCNYAAGGGVEQTGMGLWVDNGVPTVPVNPLIVHTVNPNTDVISGGCTTARSPYNNPPSFYLPCPQFRSPSIGAPTGTGNGFEYFEYDARTNGLGHAGNAGSYGFAWNLDGTGDQHLFWDFDTDNLLETMRIQGNNVVINGIEVKLDWSVDNLAGGPKLDVDLSWNGGTSWTTAAHSTGVASAEDVELISYVGGSTDTWGRTWDVHHVPKTYPTVDTVSELGDDLRLRVKSTCTTVSTCTSGGRDFFLDHVQLKVHWGIRDNLVNDGGFDSLGTQLWTPSGTGAFGCFYRISTAFGCTGATDLLGEYHRTQWIQNTGTGGSVSQAVTVTSGQHRLEGLGRMSTGGGNGYVVVYNSGGTPVCSITFTAQSWAHKFSEGASCNLPTGTVYVVVGPDSGKTMYIDAVKLMRMA